MAEPPLVLVSNRGPVTFGPDGEIRRGTGGLVTALIGLASHREVTWIASAMTEEDVSAAERVQWRPFLVSAPGGGEYRVKLVASDPEAYDRFYNIIANPMLWFIQHYLWDLSNAPDIRRNETEAFEFGYNVVNEDLARAVLEEIEDIEQPVVMVHDYHLYTLPALIRRARPDAVLHHFVHIPWSQSDSWRVLPRFLRDELYNGILSNDIIGFHTRSYRRNFLQCVEDLCGYEVDHDRGIVTVGDRDVWVRAYPLPIDATAVQAVAERSRTRAFEAALLRRRRDHLILRVDRADLSKNVLRGFSAFDTFLEQHPEFHERVTFIAQLMPSRTDVPEYAEYLERIEAVVAVVNHRHGRPRGGGGRLQALRRADRQRDVRRHEPRRQGGADGQRAGRGFDPVREYGRPRGAGRVRPVGESVRHPGAGRLDPCGADDVRRRAPAPP
jgi:trehalose 6-phosphate synthase